jgi:hypothetical protein
MIYKYKINYKSLGGSRNRNETNKTYASMGHWLSYDQADPFNIHNYNEEGKYMYPQNTNPENTNPQNTNQQNKKISFSFYDSEDEDEDLSHETYRKQFKNYLSLKKYVNEDLENKIINQGIIEEEYKNIFDEWLKEKFDRLENLDNIRKYFKIPLYPVEENVLTSSTSKNLESNQPTSSSSTSNMTNDENSVFDPKSNKRKKLDNLLIQNHTMKLGRLNDDNINKLTEMFSYSDAEDKIRINCFIKEQNLIAKRDELLEYKFNTFNQSSNDYNPTIWRDPDLVRYINNYTYNLQDREPIRFIDQVNIVTSNNPGDGSKRKTAYRSANNLMKHAIKSYYENILNRLREECEKEIEELFNILSIEQFPNLKDAFRKEK